MVYIVDVHGRREGERRKALLICSRAIVVDVFVVVVWFAGAAKSRAVIEEGAVLILSRTGNVVVLVLVFVLVAANNGAFLFSLPLPLPASSIFVLLSLLQRKT